MWDCYPCVLSWRKFFFVIRCTGGSSGVCNIPIKTLHRYTILPSHLTPTGDDALSSVPHPAYKAGPWGGVGKLAIVVLTLIFPKIWGPSEWSSVYLGSRGWGGFDLRCCSVTPGFSRLSSLAPLRCRVIWIPVGRHDMTFLCGCAVKPNKIK